MWAGKNILTFTAPLRSDFNSVEHSVKYKRGVKVCAWSSHTPGGSWCVKALRIEIYGDEFLSSIRLHVWNKKVSQQHFQEMQAALNRKKPLSAAPIDQSSIYTLYSVCVSVYLCVCIYIYIVSPSGRMSVSSGHDGKDYWSSAAHFIKIAQAEADGLVEMGLIY